MAKINRLTGIINGGIGNEVYYGLGGKQVVRGIGGRHKVKNTEQWIDIKATLGELSSLWRELPAEIKAIWEIYAKTLGSAGEVEKNRNVSYRLCPIRTYPPRPKNMGGQQAFVSANMRAYCAGMDVPLLIPPVGVSVPPPPGIECAYQRESGELVVRLHTPKIADRMKVRKAVIWITAFRSVRGKCAKIIQKQIFDVVDISASAVIEKRYVSIKNRALLFKAVPYLRIYIGAQIVVAPDTETAPVTSCGTWLPYWILNNPRYVELEDLIMAGEISHPAKIRFGENFKKYVQAKRRKLAKSPFKLR